MSETAPRSLWRREIRPAALALAVGIVIAAGVAALPHHRGATGGGERLAALRAAQAVAAANGSPDAVTASAVTTKGTGEFADLSVTVGQTSELVNQSVVVTWAWGGQNPGQHATIRDGSAPAANFMQIMQCWGDQAPDRTQCEFGGLGSLATSGATFTASRRLFVPSTAGIREPADPLETFCWPVSDTCKDVGQRNFLLQGDQAIPASGARWAIPFRTVDGQIYRHDGGNPINPFFGEFDTNELPYGITRPDGKGFETFELQTYRESAGLGCADVVKSGALKGTPRSCWLVVVPRGTTEVNGKAYNDPLWANPQLQSSPLSLTNWNKRIQFKLGFQAIGQPCPISAKQRLVGGVETSAEAVLRWQPALCRNGGAVYGYSKLADAVTENALTGNGSTRGLSFLNAPLTPADVPSDRTLVYAPMTLSGIDVVALVEANPKSTAPADVLAARGARVTDIRLTPRLVAKLLTQSYGRAVDPRTPPGYISKNPLNIDVDPDFLAANPQFRQLDAGSLQVVMPTGVSYTTRLLWQYVLADDAARDFVAGVPDEFGMRVNPFYQGLPLPQDTLPKIDPYCRHDPTKTLPNLCVFDMFPAVADFRESSRQVARGDTLSLQWVQEKAVATDPDFVRVARQQPGSRGTLGISDTATAARFKIIPVRLRNASGAFVAPDRQGLLAGLSAMKPSGVAGVRVPDVATTNKNAYPLTVLTYAVSAPNQLTVDAAKDYAAFIRYAVGPGQAPGFSPGTLPEGYVPLPPAQRKEALVAADKVQRRVGPPPAATPSPSASSSSSSSPPAATPSAGPSVTPSTPAVTALPTPKPVTQTTPSDALVNGIARYAVVAALLLGSAGLLLGPLVPRVAERLRR